MRAIDSELLTEFLKLAGERLEGDWVLLGGTVLPALGIGDRVTLDIDIAGPPGGGQEQLLAVMEIAEDLGLPAEAVNPAAAFFLQRIRGWQKHLVLLHRGAGARIHRPDATLFLLLKLRRLSEADLSDCLAMLRFARREGERLDRARVRRALSSEAEKVHSPGWHQRAEILVQALKT
ncbi:MAG: hypothetical protein JXR96_29680 [Deltaproteobacteria bacterium]|nr:hypothetical protein [Deltaproteobacteria bacterium]